VTKTPVPTRARTIKGTARFEGKLQIPSKNSIPKAYNIRPIIKNAIIPAGGSLHISFILNCWVKVYGEQTVRAIPKLRICKSPVESERNFYLVEHTENINSYLYSNFRR